MCAVTVDNFQILVQTKISLTMSRYKTKEERKKKKIFPNKNGTTLRREQMKTMYTWKLNFHKVTCRIWNEIELNAHTHAGTHTHNYTNYNHCHHVRCLLLNVMYCIYTNFFSKYQCHFYSQIESQIFNFALNVYLWI